MAEALPGTPALRTRRTPAQASLSKADSLLHLHRPLLAALLGPRTEPLYDPTRNGRVWSFWPFCLFLRNLLGVLLPNAAQDRFHRLRVVCAAGHSHLQGKILAVVSGQNLHPGIPGSSTFPIATDGFIRSVRGGPLPSRAKRPHANRFDKEN